MRLKGINEGISSSRVGQKTNTSDGSCDSRVLILENDSLATKLKLMEQIKCNENGYGKET